MNYDEDAKTFEHPSLTLNSCMPSKRRDRGRFVIISPPSVFLTQEVSCNESIISPNTKQGSDTAVTISKPFLTATSTPYRRHEPSDSHHTTEPPKDGSEADASNGCPPHRPDPAMQRRPPAVDVCLLQLFESPNGSVHGSAPG